MAPTIPISADRGRPQKVIVHEALPLSRTHVYHPEIT